MPKRTTATIAMAAVIVLGLTGCSGAVEEPTAEPRGLVQSVPSETPDDSETPEPLVAETLSADATPEELFVVEARERLAGLGTASTIPNATDEQLITGGHQACEELTAGTPFNDVTVIDGEERSQGSYLDSAVIATAGLLHFCQDMNGKTN